MATLVEDLNAGEGDRVDALSKFVEKECAARLAAYEQQPRDTIEHYETEVEVLSGGYAYRQLFELVQNGADAILEGGEGAGRIYVRLDHSRLITANTGAALDEDGVVALLNARSSSKRAGQIGRFGIGFKSLLKLGGTVDLVSRSIGLRFDPEWCRSKIRAHLGLPEEARAPGMRLAKVLDPRAGDSPLSASEFEWAATVVTAEIKNAKDRARLVEEMAAFPAEFVLFLSSDIELVLEVVGGATRTVSKRHEGDILIVDDGTTQTRWRLFERDIAVDDPEAKADALHLQARETVPLSWAAPVGGREAAGTFWAFFPTRTPTLASGILNAPWKLNSDRTNVIPGAYNWFLMEAAAELIADNIANLASDDDPGAPISALPRKVDRQDEVAAPLVESLWQRLVQSDVVASAAGEMKDAYALFRHPVEEDDLLGMWVALAEYTVRAKVVHPTCQSGKLRSSRLDALAREATERLKANREALIRFSLAEWIEFIASDDLSGATAVLRFVSELKKQRGHLLYELKRAKFIPSARDGLISPEKAIICPPDRAPTGMFAVAPALVENEESRRILVDALGIDEMGDELWESVLEDSYNRAEIYGTDENWAIFWANFEEAPAERVAAFLEECSPEGFCFRSRAESFEARDDLVLLDNDATDEIDPEIALDSDYHAGHWDRIPDEYKDMFGEDGWDEVGEWEGRGCDQMRPFFKTIEDLGRRKMPYGPRDYLLGILRKDAIAMPLGWRILPDLPPALAAKLTDHLIVGMSGDTLASRIRDPEESHPYSGITFGHTTRPDNYPRYSAPHPFVYWLHRFGWVELGERYVPLSSFTSEARQAIRLLGGVLATTLVAYFDSLEEQTALTFPWTGTPSAAAAGEVWSGLFELAWKRTDNFASLVPLWELAAKAGYVPDLVPTRDGPVPIGEIYVGDHPASRSEVDDGRIVILSEGAAVAWQAAGARPLSDHTQTTYQAKIGEPLRLSALFPELAPILKTRLAKRLDALWVQGLEERSGPHARHPVLAHDHGGLILIERALFEAESWTNRTTLLLEFLHTHQFVELTPDEAMAQLIGQRVVEARARVRAGATIEQRLLLAVGGSRTALFAQLSEATREAIPGKLSDEELAALTLAVHGPTILSNLRDVLTEEGLAPPGRWGGEAALSFVLELGFPAEFAASANLRRTAEWIVNGPIHLPPLHDYQEDILDGVEQLFDSGSGRRRAVISLPTGGGKTRVAAEAIVRLILNGTNKRTVLWVAQTDELCEQAVQCFRQLWVNIGSPEEDLRIVRLWGGQNNPAPPEANEPVVVVASIQTLNARLDVEQLDWLSQPGVVVIDECHHAIAPSYSSLLRWLDVQTGTEAEREEEPPVIGLSATPWRGYDDDESRRLAARFDQRWLPNDQHELHQQLLEQQVLAKLTYHPIRYDKIVELSAAEIRHLDQYKELPESFVERIGSDPDRNERIIECVIKSRASSILLFANSVKHAQYLAARLHLAGCPAAAVSGETDRLARQHFIRRFKSGELRVLCNHSVLTTGFDAPKADMILISRPVMSPVRYMQMVGRGLRGPKNGGTEQCRIITVEDNILNYRDQLAYHFCRRFFEA